MTSILKPVLLAAAAMGLAAAPAMSVPALAATAQNVAIADLEAVVAGSNASKVAAQQRQVTYKAQIDQYNARTQQLQAQLQPLADKFNRDRAAPGANQAALQTQADTIQKLQQSGQAELSGIVRPVVYSEAYVNEQIADKLDQAVKTAMTKAGVTLLIAPQAVLARQNANDLTAAITTELNALIPNAQLVPPAGWEPRQIREARAAQAQQGGAAPAAPAPATPSRPADTR